MNGSSVLHQGDGGSLGLHEQDLEMGILTLTGT